MKLSNLCISKIQSDRAKIMALALGLNFTELWINKLLDANKNNGPLTTAKSLQVIKEQTDLTDLEILEEVPEVKEPVK